LEFPKYLKALLLSIISIIDEPILALVEDKISKIVAGILGGFLGGFLSVCFFIFRKLFKDALTQA
jgi:uncharacterized protein involved in exopolysaccharide biosynthesis